MGRLLSPHGVEIDGTLERLEGCALISDDSVTRNADGSFDFDFLGETRVYWDGQQTVTRGRKKERVFVDQDGNEWRESDLTFVED